MTAKTKTSTHPKMTRAATANDPITMLRELASELARALPEKVSWSLGRDATCDVVLDRPYVSAVHCYLERRPTGLRVTNNSKNGTWFRGADPPSFELRAGEVFEVGETTLLAMTAPMVNAEPELRRVLGATDHARVGHALRLGATASAAVLVGEPGSGHVDVALLLHGCSPRRTRRLEVMASVDDLRHLFSKDSDVLALGAVVVELAQVPRLRAQAPELARGLEEMVKVGGVGVFVACEDARAVPVALGFGVGPEQHLEIPPLRKHADDIAGLLDALLGADAASRLGDANRRALARYRWRGNLDELRDACDKLRPLLESDGKVRAAARASGQEHTTLLRLIKKLGLTFD